MNLDDKPIDLSQMILELLKHNQNAQAMELCRKRLSVDANDQNAKYYLGLLLIADKDWVNGLDLLLSLPIIFHNNIKLLEAIIIAALHLKRNDLILKYGETFLQKQMGLKADIAFACGEIFMKDKQDNLAYQFFKIASVDPKTAEASHLKIMEIYRAYNLDIGLEHALLYLKFKPDDLSARLKVASFQVNLNNLAEVERLLKPIYEIALRGDVILGVNMVELAHTYLTACDYEKCKLICEYTIKRTNNADQLHYILSFMEGYYENYGLSWEKSEYRLISDNPFNLKPAFKNLTQSLKPIQSFNFSEGYRLILLAEHGIGDNIQMMRYLPLLLAKLKQSNGRLDILIPPTYNGLQSLFAMGINGNIITQANIVQFITNPPPYDGMVGIISLPHLFAKEYPMPIPPNPFRISPNKTIFWQNKLPKIAKKIRIGLSLSTSTTYMLRRFPIELIQTWLDLDLEFILIQDKIPAKMKAFIKDKPNIISFEHEIKDFEDSAAILQQCDLFIGVDSSMAHLAATQGMRTIMLHPNPAMWRFPDRKLKDSNAMDSLWYPSMEIIRQPSQGDWQSVAKLVESKLIEILNRLK